tara:strand:- start:2869 stop:3165 length:297 start_codon:yes stop_codon:yes gene_type:complete
MKRDNITKNDVSKEIYSNLGIPIIFSEKIVNLILEVITEGLNKNNKVKISGFGTFKLLNKAARPGRNPKTKEDYEVKARKTIAFYPSAEVKKIINDEK